MNRIEALAKHLECEIDELREAYCDTEECRAFNFGRHEYLVLTESEADEYDSREHFIATYDFNECEEGEYFIYRLN